MTHEQWLPCTDPPTGSVLVVARDRNPLGTRLAERGHLVRYVATEGAVPERLDEMDPDLLIVEATLPADGALAICLTLRGTVADDRPIIVTGAESVPEEERFAFVRAGAWEFIPETDTGLLTLLRIETLLAARRTAVRERRETMTDPATGLYNRLGLSRRARELGAQAMRTHDPLACVVFRIDFTGESEATMHSCGRIFHEAGRESDVIARFGAFQIAVLAPNTDLHGVVALAQRLAGAVRAQQRSSGSDNSFALTASYNAVDVREDQTVTPIDLVAHTASALRNVPLAPAGPWLFSTDLPRWRSSTAN